MKPLFLTLLITLLIMAGAAFVTTHALHEADDAETFADRVHAEFVAAGNRIAEDGYPESYNRVYHDGKFVRAFPGNEMCYGNSFFDIAMEDKP